MIEYILIAQLVSSEPEAWLNKDQPCTCYRAPKYSKPVPQNYSVPSSRQVEQFEEELFDRPNG
jgi:hypothetical protein